MFCLLIVKRKCALGRELHSRSILCISYLEGLEGIA